MPWKITNEDNKYCLRKRNADGSMGDLVDGSCHASRADTLAMQRAMYASESKEITDATLTLLKEITDDDQPDKPERAAAVLEEWKARTAVPEDEEDEDEDTPAPDDKPEEALETEECKKPKPRKKDLLARLKEVYAAVTSWFKDEDSGPDTGGSPMTIWKEGDNYWWLARYSNKYRDQDNPPEIISSDSHRRFARMVKEGQAPLPELWLWHKKEWKVGQALSLAYDELGFAVAIGTFDADKSLIAEALMNSKDPVRVSHGMPITSIQRDEKDRTIIVEHETREISPLPAWAAANKLTGFVVLNLDSKEDSMIPDEIKTEWVSKLGIDPKTLESLEAANAADAAKAVSEGLESKEVAETAEVAQPATQEVPVAEPVTPPVPEATITMEDIKSVVTEVFGSIVAPALERISTLENGMKELKEAASAQAEAYKGTPAASLANALIAQFSTKSAVGSDEARVDGRESLAKSKPKETAAPADHRTGIPFVDAMLAGNKQ